MQSSKTVFSWLVLGPIFNKAHQTDQHYAGDGHPTASDIIMDIDHDALDPIALTASVKTAPTEWDTTSYGNGKFFNAQSYPWRALSFANVDWDNIHEIEDNIHRSLGIGVVPADAQNPRSFAGKHHTLAFFLVNVHSPNSREAKLYVRSDDSIRVWLNGKEVESLRYAGDRDIGDGTNEQTGETCAKISLRQGRNILLAAVAETHVEWGFSARIENAQGLRIAPTPCDCDCHGDIHVHVTVHCDGCESGKPPKRPCCPPPEPKCQSGTVDIPQPPLFTTPTSPDPHPDRPSKGDPGEKPWFRSAISEIQRKGPTFGPRKDEFLPLLLVRAAANDRGARPFNGVFWESPDIFVVPNLEVSAAPLRPTTTGGIARANAPNTLYAHVWNLGKAPAYRVRVEFYWFNPSLNFSRASANLIGATWIDLANRFTLYSNWQEAGDGSNRYLTRGCHAIVRCPESWVPQYENNGHECLVVRAFEPILDSVQLDQLSAASDRHIGQRNIAVQEAASPADIDLALDLGYVAEPGEVEIDVEVDAPSSMEWLQLYLGRRANDLQPPVTQLVAGFLPPMADGVSPPPLSALPLDYREQLLRRQESFHRGCDPVRIAFHAGAANIGPQQAQILRIRQRIGADIVGGYSVVLIGRG